MVNKKESPMKLAPLAAMAIVSGVKAGVDIFSGFAAKRKAQKDLKKQQAELDKSMSAYENFDFRIQNPYEDLTVSTEGQKLANEQMTQQSANTLQSLKAGTTGAGAASLATAISRQGASNARAAQASTANQEAANQRLAAGAQEQIDQNVKQQNFGRTETLAALSQQNVATSQGMLNDANAQITGGVGDLLGSVTSFASQGGFGGGEKTMTDPVVGNIDGDAADVAYNTRSGQTFGMNNPSMLNRTGLLYNNMTFQDLNEDPNFRHLNSGQLKSIFDEQNQGSSIGFTPKHLTLGGITG